ncbi:GDP-mannose 4,6-dehydratase [Pseudomonas sp. 10B1]|uniref:GDP-mannose 4,6-dehydratase n=1 Tax=unclassified Pseudomonas TaxID=196821 RepID=UPI002B23776F|nr:MULTISPECIES: GDP-mannose 4,6-dehydratase [unclassified Pseudomonas]MEA9994840.1 GDP-mannose 4,6-dehydratase [Pseudomonas sp. AA4]MEB0089480.1 GDP-mannose 4,6-dehydratase [Pseudomonas sp. RTI1]MEB0127214.1 GDP-mannose 4,6-dehydratase [Pseudomonas sp. CCC1.2]MEB0155808.1 GDP-mannose 4,6-dehydratase [Pseudomonas sp. CCC4.3]MEB0219495.1 GDP-mannose 4,6-dehydratase [Pseudomonas sp. AB12(2023)]
MAILGNRSKVLITGLSGFTGKHLGVHLSGAGWSIAGLGGQRLEVETDHLEADLNDTEALTSWIREIQPSHVIHLAALTHVTQNDALSFYKVNVLGTESLLIALLNSGVPIKKIVIASSANIYGNSKSSPIAETAIPQPVNHYALSKLAMENLLGKWHEKFSILTVRPFNYTGASQSESFVFSKIVGAFSRKEKELRLGNLDVSRDLSDISVVVEAYSRLLDYDGQNDIFNVCSGRSVSLMDVIDIMEEIAGYRPTIVVDQAFVRSNEIKELYGSPEKLFSAVGKIKIPTLYETLSSIYDSKLKVDIQS